MIDNVKVVRELAKNKIELTDVQRSIRAYEVKLFTKKSIFEWFKKTKSPKYLRDKRGN